MRYAILLKKGWLQLYCVDNIAVESWFDKNKQPKARMRRHIQFNNYLLHEVMPLSLRKTKMSL